MSVLAELARAADPALRPYAAGDPGRGELAEAAGGGTRGFVVEAIREGYLLHYGEPRIFSGMDDDLRLLAGDALYALGLERLAREGDLAAVGELSELITESARAEAEGRAEEVGPLWLASAERLAGGGLPAPEGDEDRGGTTT